MTKLLTLYRGDDINNERTRPGLYRSEGILSGAFGNFGDPLNIERLGFLQTIKQHVDHLKDFEKNYYGISDYISFSESEEKAKAWASKMCLEDLILCQEPYKETRYVFRVEILFNELKTISEGVWEYNFFCNPNLKCPSKLNDMNPIETIALDWALKYSSCNTCNNGRKNHSLIVVNPLIVLNILNGGKRYERATRLIQKNAEWLLLPNDLINFGKRGTRIQVADFWKAQGYIIKGEKERNANVLPYPGY